MVGLLLFFIEPFKIHLVFHTSGCRMRLSWAPKSQCWVRNPLLVSQPCLGSPALWTRVVILEVQVGRDPNSSQGLCVCWIFTSLYLTWWSQRSFPASFILWFCDQFWSTLPFHQFALVGIEGWEILPCNLIRKYSPGPNWVSLNSLSILSPAPWRMVFFNFCYPGASTAPCGAALWKAASVGAKRFKGSKRDLFTHLCPMVKIQRSQELQFYIF